MIFEFTASPHFNFIKEFAVHAKIPWRNDFLEIPKRLGEGYVRQIIFDEEFRLLIHRYTLKEELIIKRHPSLKKNDFLSIFFYNNEAGLTLEYNDENTVPFSKNSDSAVQVTTNDLQSTIRFPANTQTDYIVIGITASKLRSFLSMGKSNATIELLTREEYSFLLFDNMSPETMALLKRTVDADKKDLLNNFFIRIKAQELLYQLSYRLAARDIKKYRSINSTDAGHLLIVRKEIVRDLSVPPQLKEMAHIAQMSETKLKQLFKQTFGDTIYGYFQQERMKEAAFLLRQAKLSVSETGYELGFSNLSHFSRLFKRYYGITPKKYTSVV